ncbi:UBX domain-containing protein 4 [Drosophila montana]|uniref:UBX domain-containing protein 4 n=1 Tax=Drosophila montana TaxID=40370 RepID=UPI00313CA506
MNWHTGNIAEAVAESKAKDAIFVLYIQGQDEMTANLDGFLKDARVTSKLQTSDFVAVKIRGDSEAYAMFISLYKVVPVPSIFFIGKSGTPLDIATGIIGSVEELVAKIDKVLLLAGKQANPDATTSIAVENEDETEQEEVRTIAGADSTEAREPEVEAFERAAGSTEQALEQESEATVAEPAAEEPVSPEPIAPVESSSQLETVDPPKPATAPQTAAAPEPTVAAMTAAAAAEKRAAVAATAAATAQEHNTTVMTNGMASIVPIAMPLIPPSTQSGARSSIDETNMSMSEIQMLVEQRKQERLEEQKRRDKENELRRRREGREAQAQQVISREQELKILQERIRRERQQEQETRERILAQIAADRAEMANRGSVSAEVQSVNTCTTTSAVVPDFSATSVQETRLQIRLPGGITRTRAFPVMEPLTTVRGYVLEELLAGSNIREFTLATSYPRREFKTEDETKTLVELNLVPNAVLLVLKSETTNRVVRSSSNLMNIVTSMIWAILTPAAVAFDYINKMGFQRLRQRFMQMVSNVGWSKPPRPAADGDGTIPRNMDLFMLRSTSGPPGLQQPTPQNAVGSPAHQVKPTLVSHSDADASSGHDLTHQRSGGIKPARYGESNIRRLADSAKDDDEDKATYNGNSTQQQ